MAETIYAGRGIVIMAAIVALVILAGVRVRLHREVRDATERDDGDYWRSLSWEERARYLRRVNIVSWAFSLAFILTLVFGVWSHWYSLRHPLLG